MRYTNPIIPGFHPDPSICRVGDDYYLVNSSFEYTPGVPIFHSRDLVNWHQIGYCLTRPSQLPFVLKVSTIGIYAPTIRYSNGTFYLVTTNVDLLFATQGKQGNFYVTTDDPAGEWSEPIWIEKGHIDPSLFFDDDGRVYLTAAYDPGTANTDPNTTDPGWGIQQCEIDIATGQLLSEPRIIWSGTGGNHPEGPHLYKVNGRYYLMIAEGGTEFGHMVTIARSDNPWGPWEACPHNPILSHRSYFSPIQATGHADLVEARDGSWWAICLGIRPQPFSKLHHLGRETFLASVTWDDGWLRVGDNGHIALQMEGPNLPTVTWPAPAARDDFDQPSLGVDWNFLNWPGPEDWSLTGRLGWLRLVGNAKRLDDGSGVAFVGRRQEHLECQAATLLDFTPEADGQEAGITVWMNPSHHYEIAVTRLAGERRIIVRRRIGTLAAVVANDPLADGPVTLQVRTSQQPGPGPLSLATVPSYAFSYSIAKGELRELGSGEARYLATEVAGGFTGVYLALYATANGAATAAPADFDWFEYIAVPS